MWPRFYASHVVRHGSFLPAICKALSTSFKGWRSNLDDWDHPASTHLEIGAPSWKPHSSSKPIVAIVIHILSCQLRWQMHLWTLASRWASGFWTNLAWWISYYVQMRNEGVTTQTRLTVGRNSKSLSAKLGIQRLRSGFCTACPMAPKLLEIWYSDWYWKYDTLIPLSDSRGKT